MAQALSADHLALLREAVERRNPDLGPLLDELEATPRRVTAAERDDLREAAVDELVIDAFQDEEQIVNGRAERLEALIDAIEHLDVEAAPPPPPVTRRGMFGGLLGRGIERAERARRTL